MTVASVKAEKCARVSDGCIVARKSIALRAIGVDCLLNGPQRLAGRGGGGVKGEGGKGSNY